MKPNALIEFHIYGSLEHSLNTKEPMTLGRVVTLGKHQAGFETIATFKTPDDAVQFGLYLAELRAALASAEYELETLGKKGDCK